MFCVAFGKMEIKNQKRDLSEKNNAKKMPPEEWLYHTVKKIEEEFDNQLHIPKRDDGKPFTTTNLYPDQKQVVGKVMDKLLEWLTCDDLGNFKPLRIAVLLMNYHQPERRTARVGPL